jgi:type I restriction enzyme, S subunit
VRLVPFGDICDLQNGRAFKPTEWSEEGVPIIRIQNLNDENKPFNYCNFDVDKKFHVYQGDLLFSWSGTPGTSFGAFFWKREKGYLNQHIFNVRFDKKQCDKFYLRYAINSKLDEIIGQAHGGVGLKHITKGKLEEVKIPLPPLPEQKRIAAILDKADELRQKRRSAIAKLDELLQATFLDMFGDPVRNPKGWEVKCLEDICLKITDGTHKTPKYVESGIEFLSAKDIKKGVIKWGTKKYISDGEHRELVKRCHPERGDIVLAKSGSLGATAILDKDHDYSLFESLCLIKQDREVVKAEYLNGALSTTALNTHLLKSNKGIAIKHLHLVDIRKLKIPLPEFKLQCVFESHLRSINHYKRQCHQGIEILDTLFSSLQQRAFKGEL